MSLLVLALAVPGMATAQSGLQPASFAGVPAVPAPSLNEQGLKADLLGLANSARASASLPALASYDGLNAVAQAHARDMATRGYVGYADPDGTSLLDQVRMSDRTALIGSFASSIAVLDADATAAEIHAAIQSDPENAANLRRGFSHAGMGTYASEGRLYVVQLFARIDGELDRPLPVQISQATLLQSALFSDSMTPVGWSVSDAKGDIVSQGSGRRVQSFGGQSVEGYLNVDVAMGPDVYTLRGPYVQVN